ncbi:MAG: ABC transporter substrate-binding protein [Oscillospiraceae bacterium]|nr:ABC transporter substrate-binding protein [Oscillospiraceae bacterium]
MKKRRILGIFLACALALALLAGCGSSEPAPAPDAAPDTAADTAAASDSHYPVTVQNYDRTVTVEKRPEKVLTLGPNCTELFAALGLGDLVIGRSLVNHSRGPLDEYADIVNNIPEINHSSATREAILSSGADFIYTLDWQVGDDGVVIDEVESYGMNVYINSARTLEEQYKEIMDIGKIFDVEDEAAAFVQDQKDRIAAVQEKVAGQEPIKVLVYDSGGDGVYTCSGVCFENLLVELAGGENIFGDIMENRNYVTVSYEEILARDPDIILIHDYDSPSVEEKLVEIHSNPVLSQLDCVKNERFATIELESVLAGDRMAYAVEQMAAAFYPDLFTD